MQSRDDKKHCASFQEQLCPSFRALLDSYAALGYEAAFCCDFDHERVIFERVSSPTLRALYARKSFMQRMQTNPNNFLHAIKEARLVLEKADALGTAFLDINLLAPDLKEGYLTMKIIPIYLSESKPSFFLCLMTFSTTRRETIRLKDFSSGRSWLYKGGRYKEQEEAPLSEKEREVLRLAKQGLGISEIAQLTEISITAVKKRRANIFRKLGVRNMVEAVAYATLFQLI